MGRKACQIVVVAIAGLLLLCACSSPPTTELMEARAAVDVVESEGGKQFLPADQAIIIGRLEEALVEIKLQEHSLFKNYALAKHILKQVVEDAVILQGQLAKRKMELKTFALAALEDARGKLLDANQALDSNPVGKVAFVDLEKQKTKLANLENELEEVAPLIEIEEFIAAIEKTHAVIARTSTVSTRPLRKQERK